MAEAENFMAAVIGYEDEFRSGDVAIPDSGEDQNQVREVHL